MLAEAYHVHKIVIACGYTDLRKGIDGLAELIRSNYQLDPLEKNVLFLFCGRRTDRIKGLLWEGDGFLLLYKRLEGGAFSWPRNQAEATELTREQYRLLMMGYDPLAQKIREVQPPAHLLTDCAKQRNSNTVFGRSIRCFYWLQNAGRAYGNGPCVPCFGADEIEKPTLDSFLKWVQAEPDP
ncbi:IS66 family insertion sequence element accessory protein TnpB [Sharpea azabuensis]|uniref:IS66 family insertion sequence element accessory protein TnpB n=1 Tax=Sharpea azabuensis TaxID=322505 RepID=UPI0013DA20E1|nr:IS66 family insertion sequence element accessory protein TnpB [Sharpea azabuensis]